MGSPWEVAVMIGELALAALIAGSDPGSAARPAIHDTIYVVRATQATAPRGKSSKIVGTVYGLGLAVAGGALLLDGSDHRHYSVAYDTRGNPYVTRPPDAQMFIGVGALVGGIAIVLLQ